jgi:hypothetical protein
VAGAEDDVGALVEPSGDVAERDELPDVHLPHETARVTLGRAHRADRAVEVDRDVERVLRRGRTARTRRELDARERGRGDEHGEQERPHRRTHPTRASRRGFARRRRVALLELGEGVEERGVRHREPRRRIVRLGPGRRRRHHRFDGLDRRGGVTLERVEVVGGGIGREQVFDRREGLEVVRERQPRSRIVGLRPCRRLRHERIQGDVLDRRQRGRVGYREPCGRVVRHRARR